MYHTKFREIRPTSLYIALGGGEGWISQKTRYPHRRIPPLPVVRKIDEVGRRFGEYLSEDRREASKAKKYSFSSTAFLKLWSSGSALVVLLD